MDGVESGTDPLNRTMTKSSYFILRYQAYPFTAARVRLANGPGRRLAIRVCPLSKAHSSGIGVEQLV